MSDQQPHAEPAAEQDANGEQVWVVKDLIQVRAIDDTFYCLVKWKGFESPTWQPECDLVKIIISVGGL